MQQSATETGSRQSTERQFQPVRLQPHERAALLQRLSETIQELHALHVLCRTLEDNLPLAVLENCLSRVSDSLDIVLNNSITKQSGKE